MQDSNKTLYTNKTNNHSPQLSELKEDTQSNKLIDTKALGKEAGHRSKKLPFIQKVQKKLSKDTKPFSELLATICRRQRMTRHPTLLAFVNG